MATLRSRGRVPIVRAARFRDRPKAGAGDRPGSGKLGFHARGDESYLCRATSTSTPWSADRTSLGVPASHQYGPHRGRGSGGPSCPEAAGRDGSVSVDVVAASHQKQQWAGARTGGSFSPSGSVVGLRKPWWECCLFVNGEVSASLSRRRSGVLRLPTCRLLASSVRDSCAAVAGVIRSDGQESCGRRLSGFRDLAAESLQGDRVGLGTDAAAGVKAVYRRHLVVG